MNKLVNILGNMKYIIDRHARNNELNLIRNKCHALHKFIARVVAAGAGVIPEIIKPTHVKFYISPETLAVP